MMPTLALPIFSNIHYASYLYKHPEVIPLLLTIHREQQQILSNKTLRNMIEREILTLTIALRLTTIHVSLITNALFTPIFLTDKKAFKLLLGFSGNKITLLLSSHIQDLIKSGILPAEKAFSYTEEQLAFHINKNTLILLRRKKISTHLVAKFSTTHSQLVETEPYATLFREHADNKPHALLSTPIEKLEILLYQSVCNLIIAKVIVPEDIISASSQFLNVFFGKVVQMLLIENKISLKQVKKLSTVTAAKMESDTDVYNCLANSNDNDGSEEYITLKVWSKILCKDLVKAFQEEKLSEEKPQTHTSTRAHSIATTEKISELVLCAKTIALFMEYLAEQIQLKKKNNFPEKTEAIYDTILQTIETTRQAAEPNWPEAFETVAELAEQQLHAASHTAFKTKLRPGALGLFSSPTNVQQNAITDFCNRIVHMTGFLLSIEKAPALMIHTTRT
jgi:hypothetical protein